MLAIEVDEILILKKWAIQCAPKREPKAPRMVEFVKALPQGPTGKILKRELRAKVLKKE
jgi:acyl-coenzyme A synthetase/AMP-(fatty) acid ligase